MNSQQIKDRSMKNLTVVLKELASMGQVTAAGLIGVSESTVSRMKDGDLEKFSDLLAACGLKIVPVSMQCFPAEEVEALRILARRSDVLRADNLSWID